MALALLALAVLIGRQLRRRADGLPETLLDLALVRLGLRASDRHWYRRVLERLSRMGLVREPWETPHEFHDRVTARLSISELADLTDAYVRARYSQEPRSPLEVTEVMSMSHRILARLDE
jgi:hypothetical protein